MTQQDGHDMRMQVGSLVFRWVCVECLKAASIAVPKNTTELHRCEVCGMGDLRGLLVPNHISTAAHLAVVKEIHG